MLTSIVAGILIAGMTGILVFIVIAALKARTFDTPPYPFDEPDYVHVGFNPAQWKAIRDVHAVTQNFSLCPRHKNVGTDAIFFAMTHAEFLKFHAEFSKHVRTLIADAANKKEAFLRDDAMTLSEMLIGLDPLKRDLQPDPSRAESEAIARAANIVAGYP